MLLFWHVKVLALKIWENLWIWRNLYANPGFRRADIRLRRAYFWKSPYRLAKAKNIIYGHTPLPTMKRILQVCHVRANERFFELGCGEGRAALFAKCFFDLEVLAVDLLDDFIQRAKNIGKFKGLDYQTKDFLELDFSRAQAVYFFATGFDEEILINLVHRLENLPKGAKVITISQAICPYAPQSFYLWKQFQAPFYFGKADIYCQVKK